jgi:transposase InsO family protein
MGNAFRHGIYCPTAVADASEFVRTCKGCQFYAHKSNLPAHILQTIPVTWPFAVWGLDIVGPLRKAPGGYTHLLVAIDKFSKWVEVRPITNLRAEQAVTFFTDIVYRFGVPNFIITDNGSQFTGRKFLELCDKFHIRVDWAAVAHPQTNGQVERANGMILQGLKAQDFRPTEQVWSKMAPRAASGCVEPQDHPEQSHWVHPVLPGLRRGGCPPHGLGIQIAQSPGYDEGANQ